MVGCNGATACFSKRTSVEHETDLDEAQPPGLDGVSADLRASSLAFVVGSRRDGDGRHRDVGRGACHGPRVAEPSVAWPGPGTLAGPSLHHVWSRHAPYSPWGAASTSWPEPLEAAHVALQSLRKAPFMKWVDGDRSALALEDVSP